MRLTKLKLADFKSFVDPTAVALPGQLVGVVGHNGCGKSNIMDAERWVLGKTTASDLRGESMLWQPLGKLILVIRRKSLHRP